jgi:DNA-binding response OmpR family regulator
MSSTTSQRASTEVRVAVLADDLIWSTRLADSLRAAGADPVMARSLEAFRASLQTVDRALVDLTARAYDGVEALELAHAAARPALAVGQHDDHDLRKRALAAGADRVYAYRKLFEDGPRTLAAWLEPMSRQA